MTLVGQKRTTNDREGGAALDSNPASSKKQKSNEQDPIDLE